MNSRQLDLYLNDIIGYADRALQFVSGLSEEEFIGDEKTQLAVVRCIEIIGEAAKSIPADIRRLAPGIPWRQIARTRDIVVHHYFGVKLDVVWQVTQQDLAPLKEKVLALKEHLNRLPNGSLSEEP